MKIEWHFRCMDWPPCIFRPFNFFLKIDLKANFQFNLISNSLIRLSILKHKSIMEIPFLKRKLKITFSISSFWKRKYFLSNPVFSKKFEIQFTLNLKNKFPSENS